MKIFAVLALFFISVSLQAHNAGNISGTVSDAKNGAPLIGINVQIKNTLLGTITDLNGKYELKNIQIGTYELVFSSVFKPPKSSD